MSSVELSGPSEGACYLVTGGAGFIGSHLSRALLTAGYRVVAVDCVIPYYDVRIKRKRIADLKAEFGDSGRYSFQEFNLNETERLKATLAEYKPEVIVHLAAQAGVRYCEQNPEEAKRNNVKATRSLLELVGEKECGVKHFLFASSSSIYGCHPRPWRETLEPRPEGIYGTSKKTGEEMMQKVLADGSAPHVGLAAMRFFTVYGPHGRPDMAPAKFLDIIHRGEKVPIYGDGSAIRDFTYVEDIVQGIVKASLKPAPFEIYNLGKGSGDPASVLDLVLALESKLGKKAMTEFSGPRAGDVPATQADITKAQTRIGYDPQYTLEEGIAATVKYYLAHVQKLVVAVCFLDAADSTEDVSALLASVAGQTASVSVVVVDGSDGDVFAQRDAAIKKAFEGKNDVLVRHVAAEANSWQQAIDVTTSATLTKVYGDEYAAADHPSSVFVTFQTVKDTLAPEHVAKCLEKVSAAGTEVVGTTVARGDSQCKAAGALNSDDWAVAAAKHGGANLLIRLDQLQRGIEKAGGFPESGSAAERLTPVLVGLQEVGNVRTAGIEGAPTCTQA